ncbi:hypothetical protein ACOME3_009249 [Neoechinorhynchus agilis]
MRGRMNYLAASPPATSRMLGQSGQQQQQVSTYAPPQYQQMWMNQYPAYQPTLSYQQMIQSAHIASNSAYQHQARHPSHASASLVSKQDHPPSYTKYESLSQEEKEHICSLIVDTLDVQKRENAVRELGKLCETITGLPSIIWYTYGVPTMITFEVIRIAALVGPALPPMNTATASYACNLMNLIQAFASHKELRYQLIESRVVHLLIQFIRVSSRLRSMEYLRLVTLGVFGALVKSDNADIVRYLIGHDIIQACFKVMEVAPDISKIVGAFVLQKIIADDYGLSYICQTYERFSHMAMILGRIILHIGKDPEPRLLKHVIRCYLRLSENPRACLALQSCLPESLKNATFHECLRDDPLTLRMLSQLLFNIDQSKQQIGASHSSTQSQGLHNVNAAAVAVAAVAGLNSTVTAVTTAAAVAAIGSQAGTLISPHAHTQRLKLTRFDYDSEKFGK